MERSVAVLAEGHLVERMREVAAGLLPRPAVRHVEDLLAAEGLADDPPDVVLVGPPFATRGRLLELAGLHDRLPASAFVLVHDVELRATARSLVRVGAIDLLRQPDDDELALSLERALGIGAARRRNSDGAAAAPAVGPRVVTVASATGGCGKTFYAVNLAHLLTQLGRRTCVVDLDLQFGEVSSALRLRPEATIFDVVRSDLSDEELGEHLNDYVISHDSGIHVLAAPRDPSQADEVTPREAMRIIRALRSQFDDVVVDTPTSLNEVVLAAFDLSDELVVLVTPDVPSVRNLNVFLQTLTKLKIPAEDVSIVMNKAEKNLGIDLDEVQRLLERRFRMVLPYAREVSRSINLGVPVLSYAPDTDVSRSLRDGIVQSLPEGLRASIGVGHERARRRRWFRRDTSTTAGGAT